MKTTLRRGVSSRLVQCSGHELYCTLLLLVCGLLASCCSCCRHRLTVRQPGQASRSSMAEAVFIDVSRRLYVVVVLSLDRQAS